MKNQDKKGFALLMAKLETAFFETISKETVTLYFDYLDDLSIGQISRAVDFILTKREKRGFPSIAEIRKASLGSMEHRAVEAWGELIGQTHHIEKTFKDPLVKEVAKVVGGGGGGRPTMAQAGGKDATHLDKALAKVETLVSQAIT